MQRTQNYNLCQWEAEDRIMRSDFNADNQKIDAALGAQQAAMPRIAFGSYVGDGRYGSSRPNSLTFDFEPKLLFVQSKAGGMQSGIIALRGAETAALFPGYQYSDNHYVYTTWSGNTVSWYDLQHGTYQLNTNGGTYYYLALG